MATGAGPSGRGLVGPVALPAWETLPFERVSPEVETMGRRLAILWALTPRRGPDASAPAPGSSWRPSGPCCSDWALRDQRRARGGAPGPGARRRGAGQPAGRPGYRREHQVEHRGELAVRGGIIDVFPSTADVPVRIDLWGDEVDRLTAFAIADQRSTVDLDAAVLFGCRELAPTAAVRAAAPHAARAPSPGGRRSGSAWPRA